jgi:hypothetical protein
MNVCSVIYVIITLCFLLQGQSRYKGGMGNIHSCHFIPERFSHKNTACFIHQRGMESANVTEKLNTVSNEYVFLGTHYKIFTVN